MRHNLLTSFIDLKSLPQSTTELSLDHNAFYGSIDLMNLSTSIELLQLHAISFTGELT